MYVRLYSLAVSNILASSAEYGVDSVTLFLLKPVPSYTTPMYTFGKI